MSGKYVVGIDIGTTKICVTVGHVRRNERPTVVGMGLSPSSGVKRGTVVDMHAAAGAIRSAVEQAEMSSGVQIRAAYVNMAGAHVVCSQSHGATGVKGRVVTQEDRQRVMDAASSVCVPLDRSVLHVLPMEFIIDGQGGIMDPIGMSGALIEVNVCVVTAALSAMENLARCCEMAGVGVIDIVFEPLASSRAVLRSSELKAAVAIMDLGGGTTDVAVYRDGGLRYASALPVGGAHFTNDLAIGLRIPRAEAERIKKQYAFAMGGAACPKTVEVADADGTQYVINREDLWEIILPRAEEVFELVGRDVQEVLRYAPSSTVVLTGGASLLEGMDRVAEAMFGVPARVGLPQDVAGPELQKTIESPICSTAVGLMLYGVEAERGMYGEFLDGVRGRLRRLGHGLMGLRYKTMGLLNL